MGYQLSCTKVQIDLGLSCFLILASTFVAYLLNWASIYLAVSGVFSPKTTHRISEVSMNFYCFCISILILNSFPACSNIVCRLLILLTNSLNPDQARQKVGPDLDPNCLTLWWYFWKNSLKMLIFEKSADDRKNHAKLPSMQQVNYQHHYFIAWQLYNKLLWRFMFLRTYINTRLTVCLLCASKTC